MAPRRPDDPGPMRVGQIFRGQYEICSLIGRGGYAWVYEARHRFMGSRAAIKIVPPNDSVDPNVFRRGQAEAQIQRTLLADEGIVRVDDAGITEDGLLYVVMELLKGRLIRGLLQEYGRLEIEEVLRLAAQIARTLGAAHDVGVIHRDFKPENVFVIAGNKIKVLDFGVAKVERAAWTTQRDMLLGTPVYMSPEQVLAGPITPASDVYALGTFIYEAISGHHPVRYLLGDRPVSLYWYTRIIAAETPPPLRQFVPSVPHYVAGLTSQMMAKKPERRFSSMHEALAAIQHCLALYEREAAEKGIVLQTRDLSRHERNAPRVESLTPSSHPTAPAPAANLLVAPPVSRPTVYGNVSSGLVANAQRVAESHRTEPLGTRAMHEAVVGLTNELDKDSARGSSPPDVQFDVVDDAAATATSSTANPGEEQDEQSPPSAVRNVPSTQGFVRALPSGAPPISRARALSQVLLGAAAFGFVLAGAGAMLKPSLVRSVSPTPKNSANLTLALSSAVPQMEPEQRVEVTADGELPAPSHVETVPEQRLEVQAHDELPAPSHVEDGPIAEPVAVIPRSQTRLPPQLQTATALRARTPEQPLRAPPAAQPVSRAERTAAAPQAIKQRPTPKAVATPSATAAQGEPRLIDRLADILNRREEEKRQAEAQRSQSATPTVRVSSSASSKTNTPPPVVKR